MSIRQTTGAALAGVVLLLSSATAGWAMGGGFHGGGGGFHSGFGGVHGGGFRGHAFARRGFARSHHHVFVGTRFFFGDPFWWGPPIIAAPPVVVQGTTPVYVAPPVNYWYYCSNPAGYYPYVQQCPGGWLRVAPPVP